MKKYKLGEIIVIKNGRDYKTEKKGAYPVYGSGGVMTYIDNYLYDGESILLPRKGTLNNILYASGKFWTVDTMYWSIVNKEIANTKFLYYYLSLLDLSHKDSGSTLPSMTFDSYYSVEVNLPDLETQNKIANVLSTIDSKIENNNKIIQELENMAKDIYNYWFLQFDFPNEEGKPYKSSGGKMVWNDELKKEIPDGWETNNLYYIADFINGLDCQNHRPENSRKLPVIKIREMQNGFNNETEFASIDIPDKYKIKDNDILFSWSATLLVTLWYNGLGALNQHIFKVVPTKFGKYYTYLQLKEYVINFKKIALSRKTTMGHITSEHINQSVIVIPNNEVVETFENIISPLFNTIYELSKESQQLSSLRDFLLPLLMSGQISIKD